MKGDMTSCNTSIICLTLKFANICSHQEVEPKESSFVRRIFICRLATSAFPVLACLAALPDAAVAQDWPRRPVTVVAPFAAGGPLDAAARVISPRMSELLGQQVVIDNVPGAGGMVGASRVVKAVPDGYTMLIGNQATQVFSQFLFNKPLYDPVAEFAPVGMLFSSRKVLVARKDLPANTLPEFVSYAKANQAKLQYGSGGGGSAPTLPASCSTPRWAPTSRTCLIAGRDPPCRTWLRGASTSCVTC